MSSHTAHKHEDKTREQLLEVIDDLEDDVERLEVELLGAQESSLSDYDDADIKNEYESRSCGALTEDVAAMWQAFYLGKESQAIEIAKRIACEHIGRGL